MSDADARTLLARIGAAARPAGSAAEGEARDICSAWLRDAGFVVDERSFTYSALPGLWGTPIAGLALLITAIVTAVDIIRGDAADRALTQAVAALALVALAGWWVGRFGTRLLPFMRRSGVNLEARRGVPTVWLIAHLDTKSQPISLLARACAAMGVIGSWACVMLAWAMSRVVAVPTEIPVGLLVCAAVAALFLALSWVGARGNGALDNASGVASILGAASLLDLAIPVGVVVTSAEELGLAGARAWVADAPRGVAINCDGVDDQGTLTVTANGPGRRLWRLAASSKALPATVQIRRSLPGVLLDSTAFADRGWATCTISQGNRGSLARVHTGRDTLDALTGAGIERVSNVIAVLAGAIIAGE